MPHAVLALALTFAPAADPWATYRGNPQRTGCTDNQPVPDAPRLLWAVKSNDHFVASPVPVGASVYVSGLGAFNRPTAALYPLAPAGEPKPTWARSAPYLRLASVSSPAVSGNLLVFGDGMHQDAGGVLHCLTADTARPVWQLLLPGDLIHLEGGPTIAGGKVFVGGGAAGVVCVELDAATLDGKDVSAAEVVKLQDARWKELQAKYEADRAKDPAFAVPPTEDQLHKPAPKVAWKRGEGKWHVDGPVCPAGDTILAASSYLDAEKAGDRAVHCLRAATGEPVWSARLRLNPWGGASVSGGTAVVTGSSVGYYYAQLKGARGGVTALDAATGKELWHKDVPGGVAGCAAVADDLVVCTATDGRVRAFALADGERRWVYDAKAPLFAPPAVAAGVVYAGDLNGVVHAIGLKDGQARWRFNIGKEVGTPGMIYAGPVAVGGKLVVATCNLEGSLARKPTCVVCLGK